MAEDGGLQPHPVVYGAIGLANQGSTAVCFILLEIKKTASARFRRGDGLSRVSSAGQAATGKCF